MGNWAIIIRGTGAHHNGKDYDADAMAKEFAHKLQEAGHIISDASFTYGAEENIKPSFRRKTRSELERELRTNKSKLNYSPENADSIPEEFRTGEFSFVDLHGEEKLKELLDSLVNSGEILP